MIACLIMWHGPRMATAIGRTVAPLRPGGFAVTYFRDTELTTKAGRRTERHVMRDYGESRPILNLRKGPFGARWEGVLHIPEDAEYGFYLQSHHGSKLWIDGSLVVDHGENQGWVLGKHGTTTLAKGSHNISIEHYNRGGTAAIRLKWIGGPIPANTILGAPYVTKK